MDFKSRSRSGWPAAASMVRYEVVDELGPPHDRTFEVSAHVAARSSDGPRALEEGTPSRRPRAWRSTR